jgi:hypothetical protein
MAGANGALAPLVQQYLGVDGRVPPTRPGPAPLTAWAPPAGPPGSAPLPPAKVDAAAISAEISADLTALGLDPASLPIGSAILADVDGDGAADIVADATFQGRRALLVFSRTPMHLTAWVEAAAAPAARPVWRVQAFTVDGAPVVAFTSPKLPTEVVRFDGTGPVLQIVR